jgi:Protein of unknown function with PCYCGC motif
MKKTWFLLGGIALLVVAAVLIVNSASSNKPTPIAKTKPTTTQSHDSHGHPPASSGVKNVPAFLTTAPSRGSLAPTLDPERFTGATREAYRAVRQIPVTIAQLPCYCYCDQGFGHKSLYSCFEDDHAAHCAVCVNEALLALTLERDQKMSPAQIRDHIVAQYANQ